MTDRLGSKIAVSVKRFERDALLALAEEYTGGIEELMALHIVRQIDRERRLRKEYAQATAEHNVWSDVDRPDEPSFLEKTTSGRSPGGHLFPFDLGEEREPVEPVQELPEDHVRLEFGLSPVIREELHAFGGEGMAPPLLISHAINSALLPPDIEEA